MMRPPPHVQNNIFNLKLTAKQLLRNSRKCSKLEKTEMLLTKRAIRHGHLETARIHAENAIRQKNQSFNYLRMSARVESAVSKIESALMTGRVSVSMGKVVKSMQSALNSMDLGEISKIMDRFEKQFENLDVRTSCLEESMATAATTSTPVDDVNRLLQRIVEEEGLEVNLQLPKPHSTLDTPKPLPSTEILDRLQQLKK